MVDDHITFCAVCRRSCQLESCVTDEWGRAVHESCYAKRVAKGNVCAPSTYDEVEEILQQARDLREVAGQLINQSDRLIEAYKQLTGHAKPRHHLENWHWSRTSLSLVCFDLLLS